MANELYMPVQVVAAMANHVALSTASYPNAIREATWMRMVQPQLSYLSNAELQGLHRYCGFSHGIGWHILSKMLGIVAGHDGFDIAPSKPTPLYQPRYNYGGWVRIFRSESARLPLEDSVIDSVVDMKLASIGSREDEEVIRGLFDISPIEKLDRASMREAIVRSDLFRAPWMVAVWQPDSQWVVQGVASRYLDGLEGSLTTPTRDLFTRAYADQTPLVKPDGYVFGTGPDMGLEAVIIGAELALRKGYRLDLVYEPIRKPLDSWGDGVMKLAETPLMGVCLNTVLASFLVAFQVVEDRIYLEGLDERDYETFQAATGINPTKPLKPGDIERVASMGLPVFGRVPSFSVTR
jgi:hypothetical protein